MCLFQNEIKRAVTAYGIRPFSYHNNKESEAVEKF